MSTTLGIIIGNRDFFPDHLITEARNEVLNIFKNKGLKPIILKDSDTKLGGVETFLEAQKCADLFKSHKDEIEGILVVLPNFGDEKGVADTIRLSGLDVPVLVQATPDDLYDDYENMEDKFGLINKNTDKEKTQTTYVF